MISEKGDDDMSLNLSPQEIKKVGEMWGDALLPTIPIEKRLASVGCGLRTVNLVNKFISLDETSYL